jgi:MerR family transcriptional regulator, light-induced transcriptional regulator
MAPVGAVRHHRREVRSLSRAAQTSTGGTTVTTVQPGVHDQYFDALVRCDPAAATDLVLELLESGSSLREVVEQVVAPAQAHVGELWERGEWSVAQEHAATATTEAAVSALWVMTARRRLDAGPHVALACAEGEWHALPSRMAAAMAAEAGAHVTVLGPSMPADDLRRRLALGDVDVLAVSCTVPVNLLGAARCVVAGHAAGVPVVVDGAAFTGRPARARAVGADALVEAPERLGDRPPPAGSDVALAAEALRLDGVDDATVGQLLAQVTAAAPQLAGDRTREDLRDLVRSTGTAVQVGDPTVLDDVLGSLLRTRRGSLPDAVLLEAVERVADGVEAFAPAGAALLRDAVHRARHAGERSG